MLIFLSFLFIVILLLFLVGFIFSTIAIKPKTYGFDETYDMEISSGRIIKEEFEKLHKEEVFIKSPYGYPLHGFFFPSQNSDKAIILCHGITLTLYCSVKYMNMFLKRGYNVLIYDHRNHGKSGGSNTTFGYFEKYDLKAWLDWLLLKCGPDCKIGIHGESMGAATILQYSSIDTRPSFYISDCPYSDLMVLLKFRLQEDFHLPPFPILPLMELVTKLRTGVFLSDVSPIKNIANFTTPVFFIHGNNDSYIPKEMSMEMYNIKRGIKKLYIAPNAGHAETYSKNSEEYDRLIGEFLEEVNI